MCINAYPEVPFSFGPQYWLFEKQGCWADSSKKIGQLQHRDVFGFKGQTALFFLSKDARLRKYPTSLLRPWLCPGHTIFSLCWLRRCRLILNFAIGPAIILHSMIGSHIWNQFFVLCVKVSWCREPLSYETLKALVLTKGWLRSPKDSRRRLTAQGVRRKLCDSPPSSSRDHQPKLFSSLLG